MPNTQHDPKSEAAEYNMPSIEHNGEQWIRMVDHVNLTEIERQQAVAEFAREVVPRINALQRTDEFQMSHDHTYDEALEDALAAIHTLAKERGIALD